MPRARTGATVWFDTDELGWLAGQLAGVPVRSRAAIRAAVTESTGPLVAQIQANASWSRTIPGAVRTRTSFSQGNPGVRVLVDHNRAPEARPFEGLSARGNTFRHPVFGHRDVWVEQQTRPFFMPAVRTMRAPTVARITSALYASLPGKRV